MIDVCFPAPEFTRLRSFLLSDASERATILLARVVTRNGRDPRLLFAGYHEYRDETVVSRGPFHATLSPEFVLSAARYAKQNGFSVVFAHSHPGTLPCEFSSVDDAGEQQLARFFNYFHSEIPHIGIVVTLDGCAARVIGTNQAVNVYELGLRRTLCTVSRASEYSPIDSRQVTALGAGGLALLKSLDVAVVGVGGTGSLIAQQLAHLGVGALNLVDFDRIEESNLNRIVGATSQDVGKYKAEVLAQRLSLIRQDLYVRSQLGSVINNSTARAVADSDFVFCCTDNHGSRAVLGQLAYQYGVPTIDMGVAIRVVHGTVTHIAGRVHRLVPTVGCLVCSETLNPSNVRHDLMGDVQRRADPYFVGDGEPQPAVISFNAVVSATAVSMFLHAITGVGTSAMLATYDGLKGTVRAAQPTQEASCVVCSRHGSLWLGDSVTLPGRASQQ